MNRGDSAKQERIERLRSGRAATSVEKRQRTIATCASLLRAGVAVTPNRLAREAGVSTWLVYNAPEVRRALADAMEKQRAQGVVPLPPEVRLLASPESIRADLALSQQENSRLRQQIAHLSKRLERTLGAEIESAPMAEFEERIRELEELNTDLARQVTERDAVMASLQRRTQEQANEIEAKTEALRAMMFARNTG